MKYFVRAVKYFLYFTLLLVVFITVLMAIKVVDTDIQNVFRNGYDSLWQIALMFGGVSAFYPIFGYTKKTAPAGGSLDERRAEIVAYMESRGYSLASEADGAMKFRRRNVVQRISRMLEDTVTLTKSFGGFELEGLRRDVVILSIGLESALRNKVE